jgi:hypothetical protein
MSDQVGQSGTPTGGSPSNYVADFSALSARAQAIVANLPVATVAGTSRDLTSADNGKALFFSSDDDVTVNVPDGLSAGFNVLLVQLGAGVITPTPTGSATVANRQGFTGSAGQYAEISLITNDGSLFILGGDAA